MPKLKTKSGAKKRFKITGTGKVVYAQAGKRHGMIKRTKKQIRNLRGTTTLFDAGAFAGPGDCCFGFPARFYKLTVDATATLTFTVDWFEGQDLGVYVTESDAVTIANGGAVIGDDGGAGVHPESVTATLAPGTYFVAIPNFSTTNPNLFKVTIDRAP